MLGFKHSPETLIKFKNRISVNSHLTTLIDVNNNARIEYSSIRSAAKDIHVSHTNLLLHIKRNKLIKDRFIVHRLNNNNTVH